MPRTWRQKTDTSLKITRVTQVLLWIIEQNKIQYVISLLHTIKLEVQPWLNFVAKIWNICTTIWSRQSHTEAARIPEQVFYPASATAYDMTLALVSLSGADHLYISRRTKSGLIYFLQFGDVSVDVCHPVSTYTAEFAPTFSLNFGHQKWRYSNSRVER